MSETNMNIGPSPLDYMLGAFFDVLDELITRNRAYQRVLEELVSPSQLRTYVKQIEDMRPAVADPPIYNDLRSRAILAAKENNPAEFVSLAREVPNRSHQWVRRD